MKKKREKEWRIWVEKKLSRAAMSVRYTRTRCNADVHAPDLGSVLQAAPHVTERRLLNKRRGRGRRKKKFMKSRQLTKIIPISFFTQNRTFFQSSSCLTNMKFFAQFRWISNRKLVQRSWRSESAGSFIQTWWIFSLATIYRNPYVLP